MPKINLITRKKIDYKRMYILCRQISVMLSSGINIVSAFQILSNQKNNKRTSEAISTIANDIQSGESFYTSVEKTRVFPDAFNGMVMIGENSGNLDNVFIRLADYYYKEYKIKQTIKQAMAYPVFILVVTIIAAIGMATTILPMVSKMINDLSLGEMPFPTRVLLWINEILSNKFIIVGIIICLTLIVFFISIKRNFFIEKLLFRIPAISSVYKKIAAAKFARSLSMLFSSGIPIVESLNMCELLLGGIYKKYIKEIKCKVESGESLYKAIKISPVFPEFFHNMIETGEESGKLDYVLSKIADFYEKEIEFSLKKATKVFEPALIISLSVVVGFLLAAVMLPLFQIYGEI